MSRPAIKRRLPGNVSAIGSRIWCYRHYWRVDLLVAAFLVSVSVVLSRPTIDLAISRWFYARHGGWPDPSLHPWDWLYSAPPVILAAVIPACMVLLLLSAIQVCNRRIRIRSMFLLLALWLGAGLIIEGIFKLNWGRPKPAQLVDFGGWLEFHSAFTPGVAGRGRSFPSSHSAIGYFLTALYFVVRRDRPKWAIAFLVAGLCVGTAIGLARIRVGGHFASDVAWSAAVMFIVNILVYYSVLNVPAYEDDSDSHRNPRRPWAGILLMLLIPTLLQALVFTLSPVYRSTCYQTPPGVHPDAVRIATAGAEVELTFSDREPIRIEGEWFGHGLAGADFATTTDVIREGDACVAEFRCAKTGWFFRSRGLVRARLPASEVTRLTLDTADAAIRLTPQSRMPTNTVIDIRSGHLAP